MEAILSCLSVFLAIAGEEAGHPRDAFTRVKPMDMSGGFDWMTPETFAARARGVQVPHHQKRATPPYYSSSPYLNNNTESL